MAKKQIVDCAELFVFLLACEVGFYKPVAGDQRCGKCPLHSHSETRAALTCPCDANFYRSSTDTSASPCTSESSCLQTIRSRNLLAYHFFRYHGLETYLKIHTWRSMYIYTSFIKHFKCCRIVSLHFIIKSQCIWISWGFVGF